MLPNFFKDFAQALNEKKVQCGDASHDSFKGDTEISYIEHLRPGTILY